MKLFFIVIAGLLFTTNLQAQYTATWALTANANNTSVIGAQAANVIAGSMVPGTNFTSNAFNTNGYQCTLSTTWPTAPTDGDNLDYQLSPNTGFDLNITGITFDGRTSGSSNANIVSLAYQEDGSGPWIPFGGTVTVNSGGSSPGLSFGALNQTLFNGHTYAIRLYVYGASTPPSSSRNFFMKNVNITGTTNVAGTQPTITTDSARSTGKYSGIVHGTITAGTIPPTASGVVWSLNVNPSLTDNVVSTSPLVSSGSYGTIISGLSAGTTYHVRVYVSTAAGTVYGDDLTFTTDPASIPSLTTVDPNLATILSRSATSGGVIVDSGGVVITAKGIVFNTTGTPVLPTDNPTSDGQFASNYNSSLTNLLPNTLYYVRAYATNSVGTGYGDIITFTTALPVPTLTAIPSSIDFGDVVLNASSVKSYTLSGFTLDSTSGGPYVITLTAPAGFIISTSASAGFSSSLSIPYTGGTLPATTIYIKFNPTSYGNFSGTLIQSGGGATALNINNVTITGVGVQSPSDFSNSGIDFWTGYGFQSLMTTNNEQDMILYLSSQQLDTVMVEIPGIGYPAQQYIVQPNVAVATNPFPKAAPFDPRLLATGTFPYGIHIYSLNKVPTAVWAHIYASQSSGATLVLPTYTWGTDYTVLTQGGQTNNGVPHTFFFVQAAEDNTVVDIIPSADITATAGGTTVLYPAGDTIKVTLNKGDVFNALGKLNSSSVGDDLTGTRVTSEDCSKKIAVFTGNGRVQLLVNNCNPTNGGSDNFIQQMFPRVAWGTKYLTSPFRTMEAGLYRVAVEDTSTNVTVNGQLLSHTSLLPVASPNQFYYEIVSDTPNIITSDKPVMVAQFCATNSCDGTGLPDHPNTGTNGDPEMVIVSPVQQAINDVTVFSATEYAILHNYINVIIPKAGVASFQFDGVSASDAFLPHTQDSSYYYAVFSDIAGGVSHHLTSDLPFNAIAYGFSSSGDNESYGYNAGTQVNDLTSPLLIQNPYGTPINSSSQVLSTCRGTNFKISATLPYQTNQLTFGFAGNTHISPNTDTTLLSTSGNLTPDSSFVNNGQTFYVYKLSTPYIFDTTGTFPIQITSFDATETSGCTIGNQKTINYNVIVVTGLTASFGITFNSCASDTVQLTDQSTSSGHTIVSWLWSYNNGASLLPVPLDTVQNPKFQNPADNIAANFTLRAVNDIGCFNDTTKALTSSAFPPATLSPFAAVCATADPFTLTGGSPAGGIYSGTGVSGGTFNPAVAGAGIDTITYTYTIPAGCTESVKQPITVTASPTIAPVATQCINGSPVTLTGTPSGGTFNGDGITGPSFDPSAAGVGTHAVTYTVGSGCVSPAIQVVVSDLPGVDAGGPGLTYTPGNPVTINASVPPGSNDTYLWSPSDGLSSATVLNPQASPSGNTLYTLTVTNSANCTNSDTVTVFSNIPCTLNPPKVFTPNGDGFNDTWKISLGCTTNIEVSVYNRWGGLVYHSDSYQQDWNGTYKGDKLPDGTYYVILSTQNGRTYTITGNVTILR